MGREGRVILGGDASFSLIHRRLSADEQRFLEAHGSLSTIATVRAMARTASGDAALIEAKAVEPDWPRIGSAVFAPPMSLEDALGERDGVFGAAVEEALLARLNLKLGDVIRIGDANFALRTLAHQRTGPAGDWRRARAARADFASGSRRDKTGSAGIAGPVDDASRHGRPRRGAGQFRRPGLHGSGEADLPSSRMGRSLAAQHFPGLQSRCRSLRRVPDAGGIAILGRRRRRRGERRAGFRRAQTRDARHSQGDWRDRIERRRRLRSSSSRSWR